MNKKTFINIYRTTRCYGGAEEGGWYYTQGEFIQSFGMYSEKRASRVRQVVQRILDNEKAEPTYHMGYGDHDGTDSAGFADDNYLIKGGAWGNDAIEIRLEDHAGRNFPKYRPTYS